MLDKGKGNTLWLVRRYERSFDQVFRTQIEKISRKVIHRDRFELMPNLKFLSWAQNVVRNTNIKDLTMDIPSFSELYKVRSKLNTSTIEICVIGHAKQIADKIFREFKPYDMQEQLGNLWLNEGIDEALLLIFGLGSPTAYTNANARLGVGNDDTNAGAGTAPAATQTGLLGSSTLFKALDSGFPDETVNPQKVRVEATFGDAEALFEWKEESLDNGSTRNKNLQRSTTNLGDKSAVTETWILRGDIGIS